MLPVDPNRSAAKVIGPFPTDQVGAHGVCGVPARASTHHPSTTSLHNSHALPPSSHTKVPSPSAIPHRNACKDPRSRDDKFLHIQGRNVRIAKDASLYAHCRSWLKNITYEDVQVQRKDVIKELPKPLPASVMSSMPNKEVEEEQEDEKSVEKLAPRDILQRHIQRSKMVRKRLREERLQRISRYRVRLSLLLPPPAERFVNDTAAGN